MRRLIVCLELVLATVTIASPRSPSPSTEFERGSISGSTYTNPALGVTWELPRDWTIQNTGASLLGDDYNIILRLLPSGAQSPELMEFNYSADGDAASIDFFLQNKGWESSGHTGYYSVGGGIPMHRRDYKSKEEPSRSLAVLDGQRHGNVNLILVADSASRLEEFVKVLLQMRVQPDWGSAEEQLPLTVPGSLPRRVRVSQGVTQGLMERKVQPTYPEEARKQHIQGAVVMLAHISTEGSVKNLFVLSGQPLLTESAIDAVSQWHYKPYLLQGNAVELETQIVVNFALH